MKISLFPFSIKFTANKIMGGGSSTVGRAIMFIILLRSDFDTKSNYYHELEHVKQWWLMALVGFVVVQPLAEIIGTAHALTLGVFVGMVLHSLLYKFVMQYRLWAEVNAYKQSIKHGRSTGSAVKGLMSKGYGFNLTGDRTRSLLSD